MALVDDGGLPEGQPLAARDHGLHRAGAPGPTLPAITHPEDLDADREQVAALLDGQTRSLCAWSRSDFAARGRYLATRSRARWLRTRRRARPLHRPRRGHLGAKRMEVSLQRLADHDPLTDRVTGGVSEELAARSRASALRREGGARCHGPRRSKAVNDTFSAQGRATTCSSSRRCAAGARSRHSMLARLGGDESLAVLLEQRRIATQAAETGRQLRAPWLRRGARAPRSPAARDARASASSFLDEQHRRRAGRHDPGGRRDVRHQGRRRPV